MLGHGHPHRPALFVLAVLLVLGCGSVVPVIAQEQPRTQSIAVDRETGKTVVESSLTGYEVIDYRVAAMAGQSLSVALETDSGANYFNIIPPDSENEAIFVGSTSGNHFAAELDLDGDWTIRVYQMRAAARRGATATFTLSVGVSGEPDPGKARAANDFGPREWDARGSLGCALGGQPMQTAKCPFKVNRYKDEEGATVFVQAPGDQGLRILYYLGGKWSTDSDVGIDVAKREDLWLLSVGDEAYEIPQAVISGG